MFGDYPPSTEAAAIAAANQRIANAARRLIVARKAAEAASKAHTIAADYAERNQLGYTNEMAHAARKSSEAKAAFNSALDDLETTIEEAS